MDFRLMLGLNEARNQLGMASSMCLCGHVLRREDGDETLTLNVRGRKGGLD